MKQMTTVVAGLMICSTLWTACNKGSYDIAPDSAASPYAHAKFAEPGQVSFSSGTLNASNILVHSEGQRIAELPGPQRLELFEGLSSSGLPLPLRKYPSLETTMDIRMQDDQPALLLRGTWTSVDEAGNTLAPVPLEFRIDAAHRLTAISGLTVLTESSSLLNLLNIAPERLTANIQSELLQRAVDPATGRILLSAQSNPDLYLILLRNLGEMLLVTPAGNDNPSDPIISNSDAAGPGSQQM